MSILTEPIRSNQSTYSEDSGPPPDLVEPHTPEWPDAERRTLPQLMEDWDALQALSEEVQELVRWASDCHNATRHKRANFLVAHHYESHYSRTVIGPLCALERTIAQTIEAGGKRAAVVGNRLVVVNRHPDSSPWQAPEGIFVWPLSAVAGMEGLA